MDTKPIRFLSPGLLTLAALTGLAIGAAASGCAGSAHLSNGDLRQGGLEWEFRVTPRIEDAIVSRVDPLSRMVHRFRFATAGVESGYTAADIAELIAVIDPPEVVTGPE